MALSLIQPLKADAAASQIASEPRPNILVILTDDLGFGDVSCNGATAIRTPNIDALAETGIRFTSGYCTASTCTPTRFSLLTGTYAFRVPGTGIAPPNSPALITPERPTLPSLLRKANYRTAVVGKWHLGLGGSQGPDWNNHISPGPNEIGFDYSFILPTTNDRVPQVFVNNGRVPGLDASDPLWVGSQRPSPDHPTGISHRSTLRMDWSNGHNQSIHNGIGRIGFYTGGNAARFRDEDLADVWVKKCSEVIEEPNEDPFFLLFCSHDVHVPRMVHERFQGRSPMGPRGDAILELDWSVGELLESLKRAGKRDNTIVVFCSDNGPVLDDGYVDEAIERLGDHRPAGPYRGGKYNVFEGGVRIPFLVSWPNGAPCNTVSDEIVSTIDLSASFAKLAGVNLPDSGFHDSQDVLSALLAKPNAQGRKSLILQDNGTSGNFGYRSGKWKLLRHKTKSSRNVELRLINTPVKELMLFDLETDPNESNDLSDAMPELVQELYDMLQQSLDAKGERYLH